MSKPVLQSSSVIFFDDVVVEKDNYRLLKGGMVRSIEPRAFDLLVYLIEHRNRVVEKGELFEQVWKQSIVTDSALTQEIRQVRRVIGDDAGAPQFIQTIPKHGYRFIAEVTEIGPDAVSNPAHIFNALAILPFQNLNKDPAYDYFVEGLTDLLITDLGKIKSLKVISRTSIMQYKDTRKPLPQIGQELKVGAVVEGTVMRVGERVRITVQLIDAATDQHVWAESYERDVHDVMDLQNEVARTVAEKIRVRLTPDEKSRVGSVRPVAPEAYEAYLKGNYFLYKFIPGSLQKATEQFRKAIEIERDYAAAYVGYAAAIGNLSLWGATPAGELMPRMRELTMKALAIDETLCQAHTLLGKIKFYYDYDRLAADREFKRAVELNPNDIDAGAINAACMATMSRWDEALAEIRRTHEIDPLSVPVSAVHGMLLFAMGRSDEAIDVLLAGLELEPHSGLPHWILWRIYRMQGMFDEAFRSFQQLPLFYDSQIVEAAKEGYAAADYQEAMRRAAEIMVERSNQMFVPPMHIARLYAHAEENDLAIYWIERAYEVRDPMLTNAGIEPDWKCLHPSPRFQKLIAEIYPKSGYKYP